VAPGLVDAWLLAPAASAVLGQATSLHLGLWHGFSPALGLSALTVVAGAGIYFARDAIARGVAPVASAWPAERGYDRALDAVNALATGQTKLLQSGYLRYYLTMIIGTAVGLGAYALISRSRGLAPMALPDVRLYEAALAALILAAAFAAVRSPSRLGAVASLGVVGYGVALLYVLFGAPDLAMTQFLVETLTVILFVLVFYHLPRFASLSTPRARARDAVVALSAGTLMAGLVLAATSLPRHPGLASYFAEHSLTAAHGRNIVNVILVDFRGLDTLGEITVLSVAGIGVYALLKLRLGKREGG
jgi:multicomponent Na+:H+ antiporter subunit A